MCMVVKVTKAFVLSSFPHADIATGREREMTTGGHAE